MTATDAVSPPRLPAEASLVEAWLQIPRLAFRLLWRHWPQLLFWFFAQRCAYFLCLQLSVKLMAVTPLLGYVGIALLILVQLLTTVMLFVSLIPSLPHIGYAGASRISDVLPPPQPWVATLGAALLPFFALYVTWGLLDNVLRDFALGYNDTYMANHINAAVAATRNPAGVAETPVNFHDVLGLKGLWIAVVIAGVVRFIAKHRAADSGRLGWTLLVTVCEAYWIYIGVVWIASVTGDITQLWKDTRAWQGLQQWWHNPVVLDVSLDAPKHALEPVLAFVGQVAGAALMPLVWLAITGIIYGLDLRKRQQIDAADRRLGTLADRYARSHFLVKRVVGNLTGGWVSKGVPILNGVRLVLRAGLPALITLCLGWSLILFIDSWGWRAIVALLGPMSPNDWATFSTPLAMLIGDPNSLQPTLFVQVLRTVLLAATLDCAIASLRASGASPSTQKPSSSP